LIVNRFKLPVASLQYEGKAKKEKGERRAEDGKGMIDGCQTAIIPALQSKTFHGVVFRDASGIKGA
jgi:hypothetical protein